MNKRKANKLKKIGFNKIWLNDVLENFHPKKEGKYTIKIYDIDDLSQEPDDGIWIDTSCFNTALGLSFIHYFFEGNAYIMYVTDTGEEIGRGIIDGIPFEEVEEYANECWEWVHRDEIKKILDKQNAIRNAMPKKYVRKRNKK